MMKWGTFTFLSFFAMSLIFPGLLSHKAHALEPAPIALQIKKVDDSECGNGVREAGEHCDHGEDNGKPGDICLEDCTLDFEQVDKDCLKEHFEECSEPEPVEALAELEPMLPEGPAEAEPAGDDDDIDEAFEECLDWAIEECRDDVPEDPEIPQEDPEDPPTQTLDEPQNFRAQGSGVLSGCSMGVYGSQSASLGVLLSLGFSVIPMIIRGRKMKRNKN